MDELGGNQCCHTEFMETVFPVNTSEKVRKKKKKARSERNHYSMCPGSYIYYNIQRGGKRTRACKCDPSPINTTQHFALRRAKMHEPHKQEIMTKFTINPPAPIFPEGVQNTTVISTFFSVLHVHACWNIFVFLPHHLFVQSNSLQMCGRTWLYKTNSHYPKPVKLNQCAHRLPQHFQILGTQSWSNIPV